MFPMLRSAGVLSAASPRPRITVSAETPPRSPRRAQYEGWAWVR